MSLIGKTDRLPAVLDARNNAQRCPIAPPAGNCEGVCYGADQGNDHQCKR